MSLNPVLVKTRPVCVHCGTKCGTRHREWPIKDPKPQPWDGTTWFWPYNPFCTLRCALAFARDAHNAGHSTRRLQQAIARAQR